MCSASSDFGQFSGCAAGAHVLSGNVFEPRALDELIPNWRQEDVRISGLLNCDEFIYFIE
jgi:electron-transferring-flavoprotein dehydrogenase